MIVNGIPGGWDDLFRYAQAGDKLRVFDFEFRFTGPTMTFWAGLVGGAFLTMATHGPDQLMVQRYLSARNRPDAARALGVSGFVVLAQFAVFLFIGVALAAFAELAPAAGELSGDAGDRLFARFIVDQMPLGLAGLTLASAMIPGAMAMRRSPMASVKAFAGQIRNLS